jgi:transposase-like protein
MKDYELKVNGLTRANTIKAMADEMGVSFNALRKAVRESSEDKLSFSSFYYNNDAFMVALEGEASYIKDAA